MKCPQCGYEIRHGLSKCLCCGYTVKSLRVLSDEELHDKNRSRDQETEYKEIDPDDIHMGRYQSGRGGSILDDLFGGFGESVFGGSVFGGGSVFNSFGSVLSDLLGGFFGEADSDYYEDEDEDGEAGYTYDALGDRVKKKPQDTVVVREIERYDENGELENKKKDKKKDKRKDRDKK